MKKNDDHAPDGESPTPAPRDKLWNAEELAEFLGVTRGHVYEMRRSSDIPHVKMGRALRFYKPDVLNWARRDSKRKRKP
jgi:excisionase family DNA binding protein